MKKLKDEYPALPKYKMTDQHRFLNGKSNVPDEMVELIMELIPLSFCIGMKWGKSNPENERLQTQDLSDRCNYLRKKILAFNFYGVITFVVNSVPFTLEICMDEELEEKSLVWHDTKIVSFDFQWG